MSIKNNINSIFNKIPKHVSLLVVSKKKSNEYIMQAYNAGHRLFGESNTLELKQKHTELPKDIKWHMVGHLQRNKVKHIAPFINLIHSVDSIRLLEEINKRANENKRVINCLIQIHIAQEKSKYGFKIDNVEDVINECHNFKNINITGLMGMASLTNNKDQINSEFLSLKKTFDIIKNDKIKVLSMGMSNDYQIAINNDSNLIRIGSKIFNNEENN